MKPKDDPDFPKYVDAILDQCYKASFVDTRTGIQKRKLKRAVENFVKEKLGTLKRYANALKDGEIDEENYKFLLKASGSLLYLQIQKNGGFRRANTQYILNQIPALILNGIKVMIGTL